MRMSWRSLTRLTQTPRLEPSSTSAMEQQGECVCSANIAKEQGSQAICSCRILVWRRSDQVCIALVLGKQASTADTVVCRTAVQVQAWPAAQLSVLAPMHALTNPASVQAESAPDGRPVYAAAALQDAGEAGTQMGLADQRFDAATLPLVNPQLSMHERDVISEPLLTGIKVGYVSSLHRRCYPGASRPPWALIAGH